MMSKSLATIVFILMTPFLLFSQEAVENKEKPESRNAGRIVRLRPVMRIEDDGEQVIFRAPGRLQFGEDGCIYCYDSFKLYKFDAQGNFVFKIIEQGQGPGEATMRTEALVGSKKIIVYALSPPKFMKFDLDGKFMNETRHQITHLFKGFLGFFNEKYYGFYEEIPSEEMGKEGYLDFMQVLYEITSDFLTFEKKHSFPVKQYTVSGAWWPRAPFDFAFKDIKHVFINHTSEYRILLFNVEKNTIEKIFTRKYKRINYPQDKEEKRPGALSPPPYKYYHDIHKLLFYGDLLWVFTSTKDKVGNRLVDVYDLEGKYVDNFFLQFPKEYTPRHFAYGAIAVKDGFIFTIDEDSANTFSIGKYEVLDYK